MNFKESDLSILTNVAEQTLHSQILGDLDDTHLLEILGIIKAFRDGLDEEPINEMHLAKTLEAIKGEAVYEFNDSTLSDLIDSAQAFDFDCVNVNLKEIDDKIRGDIANSLVGHAKEDCYIVVSPMMLTVLQAGGDSSYVQDKTSFSAFGLHEIGKLDKVRVYCNAHGAIDYPIIVGTSNAVYTFTYSNVSFM